MKKHLDGFSLIEIIAFIGISTIIVNAFIYNLQLYTPGLNNAHYNAVATQLADQCMELQVGQRRMLNGIYTSPTSPSACSTTTTACTTLTGFTVTPTITCNAAFTGDNSINRTLTVSVTGVGEAFLTMLLASY